MSSDPNRSRKSMQLVETAETLFIRHGIRRVTVEEICRRSNVSKMTFYKYFSNKTELVKYIWHKWVAEGLSRMDDIEALDLSFPEKIHRMLAWTESLLSKMNIESMAEILPTEPDIGRIRQRALTFVADAQRNGEIRPTLRPEFIVRAWRKLNELAGDDALLGKYASELDIQKECKDFFWFGILTGKYAGI